MKSRLLGSSVNFQMSMKREFCRSGPPCSRLDSSSVHFPSGEMPSTSLYSSGSLRYVVIFPVLRSLAATPRRADVCAGSRPDQKKTAVGHVSDAEEARVLEGPRHQAARARGQIAREGVPEAPAHEADAIVVGGPGGALAQAGELGDL